MACHDPQYTIIQMDKLVTAMHDNLLLITLAHLVKISPIQHIQKANTYRVAQNKIPHQWSDFKNS